MSSWIVTLFSVLSSRTWEVNTYWIQTIGRTSMPTAAICASFRFRLLGIFYWFWQQNNVLKASEESCHQKGPKNLLKYRDYVCKT